MDDLKQSVQTAVYEQKDPLLIYKFEGFELFKRFIGKVNEETISFLMKADIPAQEAGQVEEARSRSRQRFNEQKEESRSLLSGGGNQQAAQTGRPPQEKVMPAKSEKVANRNDKVSVQYTDGRILRDVKYKKVEEDVLNNRCIIID
jgi:preprotein translocase subunit SecA